MNILLEERQNLFKFIQLFCFYLLHQSKLSINSISNQDDDKKLK